MICHVESSVLLVYYNLYKNNTISTSYEIVKITQKINFHSNGKINRTEITSCFDGYGMNDVYFVFGKKKITFVCEDYKVGYYCYGNKCSILKMEKKSSELIDSLVNVIRLKNENIPQIYMKKDTACVET